MTKIDPLRPVRRETATVYRRSPLIVELHPHYLTIRHKRQRMGVPVDYAAIYELGYRLLMRSDQILTPTSLERKKL